MNPEQRVAIDQKNDILHSRLRVLYIHHAAPFGGASRSLFELIQAFPAGKVHPFVFTRKGQFQNILEEKDITVITCGGVSQFDNTQYGYYRGLRWLILIREITYLPTTFFGLLKARRLWGDFDIIHVNDITLIPAILFSKKLFSSPIVLHIRSVQRSAEGFRGWLLKLILEKNVSKIIVIDETVRRSLDNKLITSVIHNGLSVPSNIQSRRFVEKDIFTIGMVGGFSRNKGCLEFIEAAKICKDKGELYRFVFIGQIMRQRAVFRDRVLSFLGISQEIHEEMNKMIRSLKLQDTVEFWPFTLDLGNVYTKIDAVCFPSHLNAPGRPVFEAALFEIPSIVAVANPTDDTIIHGKTGIVVAEPKASLLADAIMFLAKNPEERIKMGKKARALAEQNFDIKKNALQVLDLYKQLVQI